MHIAMITGEYPPMEGGVGAYTQVLSQTFCEQGHTVSILTTSSAATGGSPPEAARDIEGRTVYRQIPRWGMRTYKPILQWLKQVNPDVLNIQYQAAAYGLKGAINLYPSWQGGRVSFPTVVTYHDLMPPYMFPKAGPLRPWSVIQLALHSTGIIVTNGEDYTQLTTSKYKAKLPPIRLIHIGSNIAPHPPEDYARDAWREAYGLEKDDLVVGFFGFLNRSKGVETLLDAAAQLAAEGLPIHVLFIGGRTGTSDDSNESYAQEIDARIKHLGLSSRVHRTGFTRPEAVSAALLSSDLCALPYREGVNLRRGTLHACLTHGCAIITTRPRQPIEELIAEENIVLVPAEDSAALAKAIQRVWQSPELRANLGANAASLSEMFTWDRIAAQTVKFFESLSEA